MRFIIIDDDIGIRKIIKNIIEQNALGIVIAESGDGREAEKLIIDMPADIVIIDLLLPGKDGIEIITKAMQHDHAPRFIMISESDSQPMITQAYQAGIEFFIHKPINVHEIVTVIKKVEESSNLRKFVTLISQTTARYAPNMHQNSPGTVDGGEIKKNKINKIFSELGILGDAGAKNIYQATLLIEKHVQQSEQYQLADIYVQLAQQLGLDVKTIEQRVRRTVTKALQNIATMGAEDYYNDKFQLYSTALFDFKEVRQEMNFVQSKSTYHGKINIKKFAEGLLFLVVE